MSDKTQGSCNIPIQKSSFLQTLCLGLIFAMYILWPVRVEGSELFRRKFTAYPGPEGEVGSELVWWVLAKYPRPVGKVCSIFSGVILLRTLGFLAVGTVVCSIRFWWVSSHSNDCCSIDSWFDSVLVLRCTRSVLSTTCVIFDWWSQH